MDMLYLILPNPKYKKYKNKDFNPINILIIIYKLIQQYVHCLMFFYHACDYNNNILIYSLINEYTIGTIERIKQNLICPIGGDFMTDPVSRPYGHIFDMKKKSEEGGNAH